MATYRSFQELPCWKASREVRLWVMRIADQIPQHERRELISNMKRAARSATRNIAEGFGRHHHRENIQFCRMSRGSLTEILDDLLICLEEKYISKLEHAEGKQKVERAIFSVNGYIKYLNGLL